MQHPNIGDSIKSAVVGASSSDMSYDMQGNEVDMLLVCRQTGVAFDVEVFGSNDNTNFTSIGTVTGTLAITVASVRYRYVKTVIVGQPAWMALRFSYRMPVSSVTPKHFVA